VMSGTVERLVGTGFRCLLSAVYCLLSAVYLEKFSLDIMWSFYTLTWISSEGRYGIRKGD